jgi:hypothetical protein
VQPAPSVAHIGPVEISTRAPRQPEPIILKFPDPASYGPAGGLVRDLATVWRAIFNGGSWSTASVARQALVILSERFEDLGYSRWEDLTVELLVTLEDTHDDTGLIVPMWRVLRSIPLDAGHGYFTDEVARFISSNRATTNKITTPTEPLPPDCMKQILRAALADVSLAEARIDASGWDGESDPPIDALLLTHEVMAYFVLLAFEWNMSIDVIASLRFDEVSPTRIVDWGDGGPGVHIQWYKPRAKRGGRLTMLADQPLRAGSILRRLRDASAANRTIASKRGWQAMPWLCAYESRMSSGAEHLPRRSARASGVPVPGSATWTITPVFVRKESSFRAWCERVRKPGLGIELPEKYTRTEDPQTLTYRAIRPAAKWAKFIATGKGLLLSDLVDDNTVEVLSGHYLNSDIAMRDIGEVWGDIATLAEEIARGLRPVALNSNGEVVSSGAPLDDKDLERAMDGELKAGMSSCTDIMKSPQPGEKAGRACRSAWRACFFCSNGVVTPSDIPAMKLFLLQAEDAHGRIPPAEWALHWGRTVRWIMFVLPLMDPDWENLPIAQRGLFDLGLETGPA